MSSNALNSFVEIETGLTFSAKLFRIVDFPIFKNFSKFRSFEKDIDFNLFIYSQLLYEESLRRLREEVIRANVLVREANQLSSEMKKDADFAVTLQVRLTSYVW